MQNSSGWLLPKCNLIVTTPHASAGACLWCACLVSVCCCARGRALNLPELGCLRNCYFFDAMQTHPECRCTLSLHMTVTGNDLNCWNCSVTGEHRLTTPSATPEDQNPWLASFVAFLLDGGTDEPDKSQVTFSLLCRRRLLVWFSPGFLGLRCEASARRLTQMRQRCVLLVLSLRVFKLFDDMTTPKFDRLVMGFCVLQCKCSGNHFSTLSWLTNSARGSRTSADLPNCLPFSRRDCRCHGKVEAFVAAGVSSPGIAVFGSADRGVGGNGRFYGAASESNTAYVHARLITARIDSCYLSTVNRLCASSSCIIQCRRPGVY